MYNILHESSVVMNFRGTFSERLNNTHDSHWLPFIYTFEWNSCDDARIWKMCSQVDAQKCPHWEWRGIGIKNSKATWQKTWKLCQEISTWNICKSTAIYEQLFHMVWLTFLFSPSKWTGIFSFLTNVKSEIN